MVVKMMKWRPWPPLMTKKYQVKLVLRRIEGFSDAEKADETETTRLMVEINWKGQRTTLSSLRRKIKRNFTAEQILMKDGGVEWDEEFQNVCSLSAYKDTLFQPWEIAFSVLHGVNQGTKNKSPVVGTAALNLAEYASAVEEKGHEIAIPITLSGVHAIPNPKLSLSLSLLELRTTQESPETVERSIVPIPLSPRSGETLPSEKDELSALKAGLRKVKILTDYVSSRKAKKACREEESSDGRYSARSDDAEYTYPFDTDSHDDFDEAVEDGNGNSSFRKSFSYGTLASANCAGGPFYSEMRINGKDEDWVYYSNRKSDVVCLQAEESTSSIVEQSIFQSSKRSLLSWKKRKLSFRSPKAKGEPLLKKAYGEEGGDDIDFDRRQLSSSDESYASGRNKAEDDGAANRSSVSEFGDDNFAVGCWEQKELISREGHMKLCAQVFFASIDQRSERAAGESACTALVAVIADWFQTNRNAMPIKSQFDSLIREGSLQWRNLCEIETYKERFPDKHFDLDTVLQAKIRPLSVVPEKSFIGFFRPDCMDKGLEFLHGAMCFDSIWDEISRAGSNFPAGDDPHVYIVSWNDHFFILKVEPEAYYILDTLGERLYEGCTQAYVLKFDKDTVIYRLPEGDQQADKTAARDQQSAAAGDQQSMAMDAGNRHVLPNSCKEMVVAKAEETGDRECMEEIFCRGKESCKEYIKSFLAAIPLRELQVDIKKGLMLSTPLHHRLQIEFHYTELLQPLPAAQPGPMAAATAAPPATTDFDVV